MPQPLFRRHLCSARLAAAVLVGCLVPALAQAQVARVRITVVEGDTLEQLALRHGVSLEALIRLNGLQDPDLLRVGQVLELPPQQQPTGSSPPPAAGSADSAAALLLSAAERRDRAQLLFREQNGLVRWRWFNATAVDWAGWQLHPGGVRITLVKPSPVDVGVWGASATAVAVQCQSLRQTWRVDGNWQPWQAPLPGSVGQRIVLDLCSNTLEGPAVPVPPAP